MTMNLASYPKVAEGLFSNVRVTGSQLPRSCSGSRSFSFEKLLGAPGDHPEVVVEPQEHIFTIQTRPE